MKADKTLSAQVQKIVMNQGLKYLGRAMDTLGELIAEDSEATGAVKVQASRAIVGALTTASGEMTESTAGKELMGRIREAEHISSIETEVPDGIKDSFDG